MKATDNLHRRYKHLFALPSAGTIILLSYISTLLVITIPNVIINVPSFQLITLITLAFIIVSILTLIERSITGKNTLCTSRRLLATSLFANIWWIISSIIGMILLQGQDHNQFFILGMFATISFRYIIIRTLFTERMRALIISSLQPILIAIITYNTWFPEILHNLESIIGGILLLIGAIFYVYKIEESGSRVRLSPIELLKDFLEAWTSDEVESLEEFMEEESSETELETVFFKFKQNDNSIAIITNDIHPGPFYPVGSSNITAQIYNNLRQNDGISPIVLHGIVGHERNLPSQKQVQRYLQSLHKENIEGESKTSSKPITNKIGNVTVTGIKFDDSILLIITLAPYGMDDLPSNLKKTISNEAKKYGINKIMIVDAHNSESGFFGRKINEKDIQDIIKTSKKVIKNLQKSSQLKFKTGYSHSNNESRFKFDDDVGPGGISVIVFEINKKKFMLIGVDANNSVSELRGMIKEHFKNRAEIEICTSDTHVTAGKTMNIKGYNALGELTSNEELLKSLDILFKEAVKDLKVSSFEASSVKSRVKIMGKQIFENISGSVDKVSQIGKRFGIMLLSLYIIIITIVTIL